MIDQIETYRLSDFIMYSSEVYAAFVETYNDQLWPSQLLGLLFSLFCFHQIFRNKKSFEIPMGLGLVFIWSFIGAYFHYHVMKPINLASYYFALLFGFEAFLLLIASFARTFNFSNRSQFFWFGLIVFFLTAVLPIQYLFGQPLDQTLLFGWGPDSTALGTLAILLLTPFSWKKVGLAVVPTLWLLFSVAIKFSINYY